MDGKGRLFGRVSVVDLAMVLLVCAVVVAGYRHFSAPYRGVPGAASGAEAAWTPIEIVLPPEEVWVADFDFTDAVERDVRSGAPLARLTGGKVDARGIPVVYAEVLASEGETGVRYYREQPLVPGQRIRIDAPSCIVEGKVARIHGAP